MKNVVLIILAFSLLFCPFYVMAEEVRNDYSWLDDMTINQLKELDIEIHKRIPYESQESTMEMELDSVIGTWTTNMFGNDCYIVFLEDGKCYLTTVSGEVLDAKYVIKESSVEISTEDTSVLAGTWKLSNSNTLVNTLSLLEAYKVDDATYMLINSSRNLNQNRYKVECCELDKVTKFDVVAVHSPGKNDVLIKKLVGLPGDIIELRMDGLYTNGELSLKRGFFIDRNESFYYDEMWLKLMETVPEEVLVPDGNYYMIDDDFLFDINGEIERLSEDMMIGIVTEKNGEPYN